MVFHQAVVDHDVGDRPDLGLEVLDPELGSVQRQVCRRAEEQRPLGEAQARDLGVEAPGVEEHQQRVVPGTALVGVGIEPSQHRMIRPAGRDETERQVVIHRDRFHDLARALAHHVQLAVMIVVAEHRVQLRRRAPLGIEDFFQRARVRADQRVADIVRQDRDAAGLDHLKGAARVFSGVKNSHLLDAESVYERIDVAERVELSSEIEQGAAL